MEISTSSISHYVEEEEGKKEIVYKGIIKEFYINSNFSVYKG